MEANFRGLRNVFLGVYIACFLFFVFTSQFPKLYAQEGKDCCSQSQCSFGYTCVNIPSPCPKKEDYGFCTKTITQCSPGTLYCPPGQYCVDYICITLGPGTPTPGGGGNYEYTRCPEGQALSCGTVAEAGSQNKKFCGYKITCNKYYWPSAFNQPEPCNVNNVASTTCTYNCSCCPIGQYRSCTLGASYTNTVSLYVGGGGDPVDAAYNQMMKDTCYRDGVKRRNDIVVSITLKRSYSKKDNTEWQDWEQSCRVQNCSCKAPPTPTLTPSKSPTPTKTPTPSPTTVPGAWIKLKNASYYSSSGLTDNIPLVPVAYDGDDDTNPYFIIGTDNGHGLVAASSINLTAINPNAKPNGTDRSASGYKGIFSMTADSFKAYATARKEHRSISSLSSISADGIYLWAGESPPTIDDTNKNQFDGRKVVLISPGSITIKAAVFSPSGGSAAFVSPSIIFDKDTREADGIFIANEMTTGENSSQGLKVVGNIYARDTFVNDRKWPNNNVPSLFMVFDQNKFLDLLPYLSTVGYEWKQTQ